ncbi:MAG: DNA polymerase III subunit delta [Gemmatimonadetes bacterium]|nr:DNA polymerase III subunit delta [Gemmatimonadota bacterium]
MAPLSLNAAYKALNQGELVPVYYLTGDADILKEDLTKALVTAAIDPAARDFNLDVRSAGDLDGESLHALVETPPMLAERRVVVVKNLEQWRASASVWKVLARYLERPSPSTVLVLVHGAGEKVSPATAAKARHVNVDDLTPDAARRWAIERAERIGITLQPDAAAHLLSVVGSDLAHVRMEIEKLASACPAGNAVTTDDVARMVGVRRGETVSDWVAAAVGRDTAKSIRLLDVVVPQAGADGVKMVTLLGTVLLAVRHARALLDNGGSRGALEGAIRNSFFTARPQGLGSYTTEGGRYAGLVDRWTAQELDQALRTLSEADRALKSTGVSEEQGTLTTMLLRMARARVAA